MVDVNKAKGEAQASKNRNVRFVPGDVTLRETWDQALALAQEEFGRVDIVINNAGERVRLFHLINSGTDGCKLFVMIPW